MSLSSCSLQTEASFQSQGSAKATDVMNSKETIASTPQQAEVSDITEASGAMVQYVIVLAIALQIPSLFDEISAMLEPYYQSLPLLLLLGMFPGLLLKDKNLYHQVTEKLRMVSASSSSIRSIPSPRCSLNEIEQFYKRPSSADTAMEAQLDLNLSPARLKVKTPSGETDEWGHFADFEDRLSATDSNLFMHVQPDRKTGLSPLRETEEEE